MPKTKIVTEVGPCFVVGGDDGVGFMCLTPIEGAGTCDIRGTTVGMREILENHGVQAVPEAEALALVTPEWVYKLGDDTLQRIVSDPKEPVLTPDGTPYYARHRDERARLRESAKPALYRVRVTVEYERIDDVEVRGLLASAIIKNDQLATECDRKAGGK